MIIGIDLCSWEQDIAPINEDELTSVSVSNCEVDDLFITNSTSMTPSQDYNSQWDRDTILHATYNGGINAGNIELTMASVTSLRLKKRKKGTHKWITLFDRVVENADDFNFTYYDRTCRSNIPYEYALVAVSGTTEGNLKINEITSVFDGVYICDNKVSYQAYYNLKFEYTPNKETSTIATLGKKHPYVISNGISNYYSGTITATFVPHTTCSDADFQDAWKYRMELNEFLNDGNPKIIKNWEGKMFLAAITTVSEDQSGHYLNPLHNISFVEIGDCEDVGDLYDNGLIESDFDR